MANVQLNTNLHKSGRVDINYANENTIYILRLPPFSEGFTASTCKSFPVKG